ncbi:MAG: hypothetical protein GY820_07290 [Gammaproteobacteria bacterium]|nr:hypothetical protein [Gammaproteobacteria bacterium]
MQLLYCDAAVFGRTVARSSQIPPQTAPNALRFGHFGASSFDLASAALQRADAHFYISPPIFLFFPVTQMF